eukprot:3440250-Pleurochrysis_carterae.AAC.1
MHRHTAALRRRWRLYRVTAVTSCDATSNGLRHYLIIIETLTIPLLGGAGLNGTATGDPTNF